jgi:hypothetical protein
MNASFQAQQLIEKWKPVLDHPDEKPITDPWKRTMTALMLENQSTANKSEMDILSEAAPGTNTNGLQVYDPVLISLVRRAMPNLIAYDVMGVQPMNQPTGLIFAMRARYNGGQTNLFDDPEAFYNEADTTFAGTGTQTGTDPIASGYSTGTGFPTATGEALGDGVGDQVAEMGFTIEKVTVTAKTRALKAEYTMELAQDLKNVHGLDAESELANILSSEILAEINREAVRSIYVAAKPGAQTNVAVPGTFNLDVDSNGRWSVEKFKGLMFQIERDANRVAIETRRGKGNVIITSSDVASALQMAGVLDYAPAIQNQLEVDDTGSTFVGILNGRYRVYIDPYFIGTTGSQFYVVGYKGASPFDAGLFYCPYVPLQMVRAVGENSFQPKIAFRTRYGMTGQQFAYLEASAGSRDQSREIDPLNVAYAGQNLYYRKARVSNLM